MLIQLLEGRGLAEHDLVHGANVARGRLATEATDAGGRGPIGVPEYAADRITEDDRKVAVV